MAPPHQLGPPGPCVPGGHSTGCHDRSKRGRTADELIPLTVPEVRRLLHLLTEPVEHHDFHLRWSWWRRAHQAVARRGHILAPARARPVPCCPAPAITPPRTTAA